MYQRVYRAQDVFGLGASLPLNYVERERVDSVFKSALSQRKHIVIHGGSKQGKTSLRKKHIPEDTTLTVVCQNKWNLSDLFTAILKQAGFRVELSAKRTSEGRHKVSASLEGTAKVPWLLSLKGGGGAESERKTLQEALTKPLELDPSDANDVIEALRALKFSGYIVLEDFHYLPLDTQKDFAFALKAFFEISDIRYIVVGVWKEADRLASYNGDLRMRIANINADAWSKVELTEVVTAGEKLLNISINDDVKNNLIDSCFESVAIVQEACGRICHSEGIEETSDSHAKIGKSIAAEDLVKSIVLEGAGQFEDFVVNMSAGFQSTQLRMYYWIMTCILCSTTEQLRKGIPLSDMFSFIKSSHPFDVQMASLTQALNAIRSLQGQKNVRPIIIDYDTVNRRLEIMDRSFLIWKGVQTDEDLEGLISAADPAG